jgi:Cd2+/Zn2+-exporting ATPase
MCCAAEAVIINKLLGGRPGVEKISVDVLGRTCTVEHFPQRIPPSVLLDLLNNKSLRATIISCTLAGGAGSGEAMRAAVEMAAKHAKANRFPKWYVMIGTLCWFVSLLHFAEPPPAGVLSNDTAAKSASGAHAGHGHGAPAAASAAGEASAWHYFKYVGLVSVALCIPEILKKAWGSLKMCMMDINILMTVAVIGACAMQDYSEGAAVVCLFALSDWLSTRATARARDAVIALIKLRPDMAIMASTLQAVNVEDLCIGDLVAIKSGDKVPVDGTVESGTSSINEANLTGESRPVRKEPGDGVHAGTINVGGGYLTVRTTALSEDSAMARLIKLVQQAQAESSPTEQLVMRIAKVYTPLVVFAATLLATVPWAWGPEVGHAYLRTALVTLIIACPCALVISTPITYVCGLAHAARVGILVKGGQHLETLGHVKAIALDKTGTLTTGRFELEHLESMAVLGPENGGGFIGRDRLLRLMLSVEANASHPMAAAICTSCEAEGATKLDDVDDFMTVKGEGVRALVVEPEVGGEVAAEPLPKLIEIGNRRMLKRIAGGKSIATFIGKGMEARAQQWESGGGTVGWLCIDGVPAAMYSVADQPRPEAESAVNMLHELGVRTTMLTGDNEGSARAVSKITGVNSFRASLLPQDKTSELKRLRSDPSFKAGRGGVCEFFRCCCGGGKAGSDMPAGSVEDAVESGKSPREASDPKGTAVIGMVGDGVNDAPALAFASVGIAMGATGTVAAMETADVTLMDTDLRKLAKAIRLGRMTVRKIEQNVVFSIVTKLAVFAVALAGYPFLWLAISCDVGAMILVTLNSSSLLGRPGKKRRALAQTMKKIEAQALSCEKSAVPSCTKGCCGGENADPVVVTQSNRCSEGCCKNKKPPVIMNQSNRCSEGCCKNKKPALKVGHEHGRPEVSQTGECAKGCCDLKRQAPEVSQPGSCAKGCCEDKNLAPAPHSQPLGGSQANDSDKPSCKKGCCSSPDISEVTVTITDAGELASCDVNLCCKAIQGVSAVSRVEYLGEKSFKVHFSSTEVTADAQIKGAVEDMGFDVE